MLTEKMLKLIEFDLSCGPQFTMLCKEFFAEESARFLLAVIRYKKNPNLQFGQSIYETYIKEGNDLGFRAEGFTVNIPGSMRDEVGRRLQRLADQLLAAASAPAGGYSRPLPAPPGLFNEAFGETLNMLKKNLNDSRNGPSGRNFGESMSQFLEMFNITRFAGQGSAAH